MGCEASRQTCVKNSVSSKTKHVMSAKRTHHMSVKQNNNLDTDTETRTKFVISDEEKDIIKRQWKVLSSDMKATGTAVFMQIFKDEPEIKQHFSYTDVDDETLSVSSELRGHAFRFMQAVGATVENIDDLEGSMSEALLTLGAQHVKFTGFKPIYIRTFHSAILTVWRDILGIYFTTQSKDAWDRVLTFIMDKLEEGYNMAVSEVQTTE